MRNTITLALVAMTGLAVSAQTPARSPQSPSSPPSASASSAPRSVTVTGCLEAGPNNTYTLVAAAPNQPSRAGGSGSTGASASGTTGTAGSATAASGSTATTAPAVKTITYLLSPSGNVDLKGNAGHQVKVTGTETPAQSMASETDRSATPEKPQGTSATPVVKTTEHAQIVARQLSVSSVSTVASKCDILK